MDTPRRPRALGIDFGERRIGLAISDAEGRWALPFQVVERRTDRRAVHRIAALARQERIGLLVVGEPLRLDGAAGAAAERARRFGAKLGTVTGLPVLWVNETLTTVEAGDRLRAAAGQAGRREVPRDGRRDAVAAQILLQEALDRRARGEIREPESVT